MKPNFFLIVTGIYSLLYLGATQLDGPRADMLQMWLRRIVVFFSIVGFMVEMYKHYQ